MNQHEWIEEWLKVSDLVQDAEQLEDVIWDHMIIGFYLGRDLGVNQATWLASYTPHTRETAIDDRYRQPPRSKIDE